MEELFVPAITAAGFTPVRPVSRGSEWIHGTIIKQLIEADMVLVDLSSHNPNVFFELGVRTSIDLPVALVRSTGTKIPFDTSGMNTPEYDPNLRPWTLSEQISTLAEHIKAAVETCAGHNPMWRQFGLRIKAEEPVTEGSREDARLELLAESVEQMRDDVRELAMYVPHRAVDTDDGWSDAQQTDQARLTTQILNIGGELKLGVGVGWPSRTSVHITFLGESATLASEARKKKFRSRVRSLIAGTPYVVTWDEPADAVALDLAWSVSEKPRD